MSLVWSKDLRNVIIMSKISTVMLEGSLHCKELIESWFVCYGNEDVDVPWLIQQRHHNFINAIEF